MGWLQYYNPKATYRSIAIKALINAAVTLGIFVVVAIWFQFSLGAWVVLLPVAIAFGGGIGALFEYNGLDYGLDLPDHIKRIEQDLRVTISDENLLHVKTLGDMCRVVSQQRQANGNPLSDEEIWNAVRSITADDLRINADELHPNLRYVEDLI